MVCDYHIVYDSHGHCEVCGHYVRAYVTDGRTPEELVCQESIQAAKDRILPRPVPEPRPAIVHDPPKVYPKFEPPVVVVNPEWSGEKW